MSLRRKEKDPPDHIHLYIIASSLTCYNKLNPVLWLATRAGATSVKFLPYRPPARLMRALIFSQLWLTRRSTTWTILSFPNRISDTRVGGFVVTIKLAAPSQKQSTCMQNIAICTDKTDQLRDKPHLLINYRWRPLLRAYDSSTGRRSGRVSHATDSWALEKLFTVSWGITWSVFWLITEI